ncbi:MAG: ribonuclease H-like domain-containing protein [Euryarchaeota archaeon]|nr:ribonuclease H-like domain-containing protein [Euryarchaeota archaeon]
MAKTPIKGLVLRHTFLHAPGVGYVTEKRIWRHARTWDDFLAREDRVRLPDRLRAGIRRVVLESQRRLAARDHRFFAAWLPTPERWRAYGDFRKDAAFLDIETTGLNWSGDLITLVGLGDGRRFRTYIRGVDLDELPADLRRYKVLVTFNGTHFDLPVLRNAFPTLPHMLHLDLQYPLRRLGHRGGLKRIEREFGLERPDDLAGLSGSDAVKLWRRYERGDDDALDALIAYNRQDVENLRPLMDYAYASLRAKALGFPPPSHVW